MTTATILAGGTSMPWYRDLSAALLFPAFTGNHLNGPVIDISAVGELRGIQVAHDRTTALAQLKCFNEFSPLFNAPGSSRNRRWHDYPE
jgi:hypothetical protein